jgi:hypothetical protein
MIHLSDLAPLTQLVVDDAPVSPSRLSFLVRRYPEAASDALRRALEQTLSEGLDAFERERDPVQRCRWLGALAEATLLAADDDLQVRVDRELPVVIDQLELLMRRVYEPGEGALGEPVARQIEVALALLTAFDLSGRLPYAMLAEELVQLLRRHALDERGELRADARATATAVQVCCRLATLHQDPDYMARAVIAPEARYDELGRTLARTLSIETCTRADAAEYGLALLDAFALNALPN